LLRILVLLSCAKWLQQNPTPACPITGQPAVRLIQSVSSDLLNGLWRAPFGVATERQLGKGRRWHGALLRSFLGGGLCGALLGTPRGAKSVELLLIARKPQAGTR
jgi:hypothetical protein